jgi:hypothetical protein
MPATVDVLFEGELERLMMLMATVRELRLKRTLAIAP